MSDKDSATPAFSSTEEERDYVYIRTVKTAKLHTIFLRLVNTAKEPFNTQQFDEISSYDFDDVSVDFDVNGKLLGITLSRFDFDDDPTGAPNHSNQVPEEEKL